MVDRSGACLCPGSQYGEIKVATLIQLSEHDSHRSRTVVGDQFTVFLWHSGYCICWEGTVGDGGSGVAQFRGSNDAYKWVWKLKRFFKKRQWERVLGARINGVFGRDEW